MCVTITKWCSNSKARERAGAMRSEKKTETVKNDDIFFCRCASEMTIMLNGSICKCARANAIQCVCLAYAQHSRCMWWNFISNVYKRNTATAATATAATAAAVVVVAKH